MKATKVMHDTMKEARAAVAARHRDEMEDAVRTEAERIERTAAREKEAAANTKAVAAGLAAEEAFREHALTVTVECGPITVKYTPERVGADLQRRTCYTALSATLQILSRLVADAAMSARLHVLSGRAPAPVDWQATAARVADECRIAIRRDASMTVTVR